LDTKIDNIFFCREKLIETIDNISYNNNEEDVQLDKRLKNDMDIQYKFFGLISQLQKPFKEDDIKILRNYNKLNRIQF
jgi:predicted membrane protein